MQLDLFADRRIAMLRQGLIDALHARDRAAGRKAHTRLAADDPTDPLLTPAAVLLEALGRRPKPFSDPLAAQRAVERLDREVRDAALRLFGPARGDDWLLPLWQALADALSPLPFHSDAPDAHAAAAQLRARQWHRARDAVETIPDWRSQPCPLAWMARIVFELEGLDAAWPLLAELAWRDPARFAVLGRSLAAPSLARLLREFDRDFVSGGDDGELAWFPAWALIARPELATLLRAARGGATGPAEQAARTVMQLLDLERQGRQYEIAAKQKALRALHETLFERYLAARN